MSHLPLDCTPLDPAATPTLSGHDLQRILPVQRTLLSPLDHATVDDWRRAVNRQLVAAFGGDSAMFQLDLPGIPLHFSEQAANGVVDAYSELYPTLDRTRQLSRRVLEIRHGNRAALWQENLSWLYGSDYFHELVVPSRSFDPLWAAAPGGPGRQPAVIHVYHASRNPDRYFGAEDVALMGLLTPALEAGVRTLLRSTATDRALKLHLEHQREGALVYGPGGELLHRNPSMARIAGSRRAERTIIEAGAEMARSTRADDTVAALSPEAVTRTVKTPAGPRRLRAVTLATGVFGGRPAVVVTVAAGPPPPPSLTEIKARHGLTPRQAEVALLLAGRLSNDEIARKLCISPHTARRHTEAVFRGLGVSDRRDVASGLRDGVEAGA